MGIALEEKSLLGLSDTLIWTRNGTPGFVPDPWNTGGNPAANLDGVGQSVSDGIANIVNNKFSVGIWAYITAYPAASEGLLTDYWIGLNQNKIWAFSMQAGGKLAMIAVQDNGPNHWINSTSAAAVMPLNEWAFLWSTINGDTDDVNLGVNKAEVGSYDIQDNKQNAGFPNSVGTTSGTTVGSYHINSPDPLYFKGWLTRPIVWNTFQSNAQIATYVDAELALQPGKRKRILTPIYPKGVYKKIFGRGIHLK